MDETCCLENPTGKPICICPYDELLSLIGKKWAVLILRLIDASGSIGYNAIYNQISGITQKAFGDKLKDLEHGGLIKKHILNQKPLRVNYSLTLNGKKLLSGLEPIFSH